MQTIAVRHRQGFGLTWPEAVNVARKRVKHGLYFIRRHGGFFRPQAAGYSSEIAGAGLYSAREARSYLDVDGLSVVPARTALAQIDAEIAQAERSLTMLRALRQQVEDNG